MIEVAVVAHSRKTFGGGLPDLRKVLAEEGVTDPILHEVTKSRFAPAYARRAVAQGADGLLELGLVTAKNPAEWTRTFARLALGRAEQSPFVELARGRTFKIRFDRKVLYELDGGARSAVRELRIKVRPGSITICVPAELRCR
jgi:hypothetical protein